MTNGKKYQPVYDSNMGVFCWFRIGDQETTMWDTGQWAIEWRDKCLNATSDEIDEWVEDEFLAQGI